MRLLDPTALRTILVADPALVRQTMRAGGWWLGPERDATAADDDERQATVEVFAAWLATPPDRPGADDIDPLEGDRLAALAVTYYADRHPDADPRRVAVAANLIAEWGAGLWGGWPAADDLQEWVQAIVLGVLGGAAELDAAEQPTGRYVVPASLVRGTPPPGLTHEATARLVVALLDQLLFGPRPPVLPDEPTVWRLIRTGQGPLVFRGQRLGAVTGPVHGHRVLERWYDLALYQTTDEGAVLQIVYRTRRPGEVDHHTAIRLASLDPDLVLAELRNYQPLAPVLGYPPGEVFRAKQERLERTLQQVYDARVSALLGMVLTES